ncbi:multiple epidermal growth factor-like domains protein 10 [Pecten maximus]|uniref:multiple epidermal growth factor-like domains protein 10 n=1 Tax=Pecten maximus TaxID=6579 RepID=UPI0014584FE7|nr:multiple epidermal growth factor-like domains protein 10 [Pecten maximus]
MTKMSVPSGHMAYPADKDAAVLVKTPKTVTTSPAAPAPPTTTPSICNSCDGDGTADCSPNTGCNCRDGYTGTFCSETTTPFVDTVCDFCIQANTQSCTINGGCVCRGGWTGTFCQTQAEITTTVCPEYFYGVQCQGVCECDRNLSTSCDPVTGECNCITGYDRPNCNTKCPDNSYGVNCLGACDCQAIQTSYCDKAIGVCVCSSGWEGTRCDTASVTDAFVISTAIVGVIAGAATLLLVLIILFILWKICRCSCTEVKHRAHRNKGAVVLMNSPITPGSNNAAISAMAAATNTAEA